MPSLRQFPFLIPKRVVFKVGDRSWHIRITWGDSFFFSNYCVCPATFSAPFTFCYTLGTGGIFENISWLMAWSSHLHHDFANLCPKSPSFCLQSHQLPPGGERCPLEPPSSLGNGRRPELPLSFLCSWCTTRHYCWARLKAGGEGSTEDEMVGWHHRFDGREFEQAPLSWWTGKPGMLQLMGSQRVRHDWVTELTCFPQNLQAASMSCNTALYTQHLPSVSPEQLKRRSLISTSKMVHLLTWAWGHP